MNWDKLHYKDEITILGRKHKVHIMANDLFTKECIKAGYSKEEAEKIGGFNIPDCSIYVAAQVGFTNEKDWFYMYDMIGQTLWHEVGHSIDLFGAVGNLKRDESIPYVGEQYFILRKELDRIFKGFKKYVNDGIDGK